MSIIYKADLHCHSKFSNKPSVWALRKFNCPESFTEPEHIYDVCMSRGMDYVTITDHNTINGVASIAHKPNVFISVEITARFPENGCKVHVIAAGIDEKQFREIDKARRNIYELTEYLNRQGIVHFLAHPLYDLNEKLDMGTLEKLLLLYNVLEAKNGTRAERFNKLAEYLATGMTRETIERLANKHNITPYGDRSWVKGIVGGSDDHGGLFLARAWTNSRHGAAVPEFLNSIRDAETWHGGEDGDPLTLAHSLYTIGYHFFNEKFYGQKGGSYPFINALANRVFNSNPKKIPLTDKIRMFIRETFTKTGQDINMENRLEDILDEEARKILNNTEFLKDLTSDSVNRKIFKVTSFLVNRVLYVYTRKFTEKYTKLGPFEFINLLSSIGVTHLLVSPYYLSYHLQQRSKKLLAQVRENLPNGHGEAQAQKVALFTDTLDDINGVAITIKRILATARYQGIEMTVITSTNRPTGMREDGVMNFQSIGDFSLPEYPELVMGFPPVLDLLDYFEREGFNRIHISTPGTVGLAGLGLAKLLSFPVTGTYHTDIPQYVRDLTDDSFLENAAWKFMIWFYNLMDEVTVPSSSTMKQLLQQGLEKEKVKPLPRWVDTETFSPDNADPTLFDKLGIVHGKKFIYVGRVSREKNLELLARTFIKLADENKNVTLVIVGDGPYKGEMEKLLDGYPVLFTGYKGGEELCAFYASADVFVFPSATDTFGNVVLEAQASGLPVIVSDGGGPKELMIDGETGIVVPADSEDALLEAMRRFAEDPKLAADMGGAARRHTTSNIIGKDEAYHTILNFDKEQSAFDSDPQKLVGA